MSQFCHSLTLHACEPNRRRPVALLLEGAVLRVGVRVRQVGHALATPLPEWTPHLKIEQEI